MCLCVIQVTEAKNHEMTLEEVEIKRRKNSGCRGVVISILTLATFGILMNVSGLLYHEHLLNHPNPTQAKLPAGRPIKVAWLLCLRDILLK